MSPRARWPLMSVTRRKGDDLPAAARDSLNNLASFYSRVMSDSPIPDWESKEEWKDGASSTIYTSDALLPRVSLDEPFTVADEEVRKACGGVRGSSGAGSFDSST